MASSPIKGKYEQAVDSEFRLRETAEAGGNQGGTRSACRDAGGGRGRRLSRRPGRRAGRDLRHRAQARGAADDQRRRSHARSPAPSPIGSPGRSPPISANRSVAQWAARSAAPSSAVRSAAFCDVDLRSRGPAARDTAPQTELMMTAASDALAAVLDRIDADLDQSLERLFAFLRIASVSTDPAYKDFCRAAARHLADDLASIGFATDVRPTAGHPVVVGKAVQRQPAACAVLRPLRRAAGRSARSVGDAAVRAADRDHRRRPQDHRRARRLRRQRPVDDLRRGVPRLEGGDRRTCRSAITMMIEGEEECGSKNLFDFVRDNADEFRCSISRSSATPACGMPRRRRSPPRCAACCTRRSRSAAPTATCIPACSAARRKIRSACSQGSSGGAARR